MLNIEDDEPHTDEEEQLAEELVEIALAKYLPALPDALANVLREQLVDELLATRAGKRALEKAMAENQARGRLN